MRLPLPGRRGSKRSLTRRQRLSRWALAVVAVLLTIWLVGGYFVVVHPVTNRLQRVDAIVVLGAPDVDGREVYGLELAQELYAPVVAISVESARQHRLNGPCNGAAVGVTVMCFIPSPRTTQGEARQIRAYAAEYGWKSIIVVTSSYHISRARLIVGRCFHGQIIMAATSVRHSFKTIAYQYVYQTAGYLKAFFVTTGC
jgi:uncharacterized SAM-binding protein YcdF (DUF218 family)